MAYDCSRRTACGHPYEVWIADRAGKRRVDHGNGIDPTSLALSGGRVTWTHHGVRSLSPDQGWPMTGLDADAGLRDVRGVLALFGLAGQAYGTASTVIRGPHRGAQSGTAIAGAGDVNGDGLVDVLVSTFDSIYVVFGRHSRKPINLGSLGRGGFPIIGSPHGDLALLNGSVAGVGDQNGDGLADVLVADDHLTSSTASATRRTVDLRRLGGRRLPARRRRLLGGRRGRR